MSVRVLLEGSDENSFVDDQATLFAYRIGPGGTLVIAEAPADKIGTLGFVWEVNRVYSPAVWHSVTGEPLDSQHLVT